jgi:hypothetical protein
MTPDMCGSPVITYLCTKITTMESSFGNPQRAYREFERRNNRGRIVGLLSGSVLPSKSGAINK